MLNRQVPAETRSNTLHRKPSRKRDDEELPPPVRASGDIAAKRPCIACGRPFESEGWHNRMCPPCRRMSEPVR